MMAVTIINPSIIPLLVGGIIFADVVAVICLILICLMRRDLRQRAQTVEVPAAAAPAPAVAASVPAAEPVPNRGEVVAAVSAALAEELGTDVSAIRILSFRKVGGAAPAAEPSRGALVAAVSAALAEELGTDVSAIRILSLQKVA